MKVKIVNKSAWPTPAYATEKSAGMDLKADITRPVVLDPLERAMIPTGLFIALPDGTEAQVRPRSGLAAKHGISVLNSPGTIDADYRGEIKVILLLPFLYVQYPHRIYSICRFPNQYPKQLYLSNLL